MRQAVVLDLKGRRLSPCSQERALSLVREGKATLESVEPLVIRLRREVVFNPRRNVPQENPLAGKSLLLHICCAPCATFVVQHLRESGTLVTGFWYNPNIHPYSEHERRRESLIRYADLVGLPMIWEAGYDVVAFMRRVVGHERFGERCLFCYRMRLEKVAEEASRRKFDFFSTTLLISPYQNLGAIHQIGAEVGEAYGISFYYENMRRGFATHHRLARELGLYQQRYCGCIYSEWEAQCPTADTRPRKGGAEGNA